VFAAAGFITLAFVSAAWSVDPRETIGRTAALALVFAAAAAIASAATDRPDAQWLVLDAIVVAAGIVCIGGFLVFVFRHDRAVAAATTSLPARYQGLGGGPNTATMVLAVCLAPALAATLEGSRARRTLGWVVIVGSGASIVASGSRGALLAGFAGLLAFVLVRSVDVRQTVRGAIVVAVAFVVGFGIAQVPDPGGPGSPNPDIAADPNPPPISAVGPYVWVDTVLRLQDDVGRPPPGVQARDRGRELLGSSGRVEAWRGALGQAADRPLVGYGFGTEPDVFVDRYVGFNSGVPENSYVGIMLQLGLVGLGAFLAVAAVLLVPAVRGRTRVDGRGRIVLAAGVGALAAGLVLGMFQSFLYAPGNNATAALWISAFVIAAVRA
jgi:O-antigen ligase